MVFVIHSDAKTEVEIKKHELKNNQLIPHILLISFLKIISSVIFVYDN